MFETPDICLLKQNSRPTRRYSCINFYSLQQTLFYSCKYFSTCLFLVYVQLYDGTSMTFRKDNELYYVKRI